MLFSAVSLVVALAVPQAAQAQPAESTAWQAVQHSVVDLYGPRGPMGVAALIDDSGLFIAHSSSVQGRQAKGRFKDGTGVDLVVVTTDEHTQLTLLRSLVWSQGARRPLKVAPEATKPNVELLAVTVDGPKSGEFVGEGRAGVMRPSLRYVPLSEVRMKGSEANLGGSFIFDAHGHIVGVLGATLADEPESKTSDAATTLGNRGAGGFGGSSLLQFGPQSVTVAYALGREVLQRVVAGFTSPAHEVDHPTIGIFFRASSDGRGVLVDSVMANSPAGRAGIQPGDLIVEVDGSPVNNPVSLAVHLFRKNVGESITVVYLRGLLRGTAQMKVVGTQETALVR
jgi:S1-C subfamily serine protease